MNFLGHLYFSSDLPQLQYANLFGDFVRGRNFDQYSDVIQKGIKLHRAIDSYIDNHPDVKELMHSLYESLPKITGIAVDLYFDHLLARNWSDFHPKDLDEFIEEFYQVKLENEHMYSDDFLFMISRMKSYRWLNQYKNDEGLVKMCEGLSKRVSFENKLPEAPMIFKKNEEHITKVFRKYMDDAIPYFKKFTAEELDLKI